MTSDTARHLVWWFLRTWSVSQVRRSNFSITGENVIFNWKKRRNRKNLFGHCVRIANLNWKLQINISRKVRASHQSINQSTGQWNNERVQLQSENATMGCITTMKKAKLNVKREATKPPRYECANTEKFRVAYVISALNAIALYWTQCLRLKRLDCCTVKGLTRGSVTWCRQKKRSATWDVGVTD